MDAPKIWTEPQPDWVALVPKGEIDWLMGRIHVATSDRGVMRELWRRMTSYRDPSYKPFRLACYHYAIAVHRDDQELCREFRL